MAEDGSALGEKCKHAFLLPFGGKRSVKEPALVQYAFIQRRLERPIDRLFRKPHRRQVVASDGMRRLQRGLQ